MSRKRGRKKSENKSFKDYLKQGGQKPKIEILPRKTCPLGKYSQWWITKLGIICKEEVPLKAHTWKEVIPRERETLYKRVLDVDLNQEHVMEAVNESFRKIFKQMRHKLHKQYMDIPDGTAKRDSPPDDVSQENWEHLCAWFESDEFQKKSRAGKGGRNCLKVNHNGGCKSFVRHRYEKVISAYTFV
ncbi:hypothetical protein FRX31_011380 [Thalictrum thalictroides]|uniref:Uncharacterized protein n=1 Tax=Thalictrum thalictroides TaxID=46969 RepID=A0A7J6WSE1_THATH|nr:hypothetical protein FRX31_011380 [Thalictrum thalictroides]